MKKPTRTDLLITLTDLDFWIAVAAILCVALALCAVTYFFRRL